ncbi:Uncharacterised protein [Campylobacter hyointestinalis subsp. hyointestinalis]|uniref:Uncharacterized protein n=1 Tax=Campylobacter hyointestinalis subsp. hyointestinalis TaxID=91352 RepID=A0A0S4SUZ8_CAMHY|nr:hypothetical protein [Campylobacter hyointestinalis]CUU89832.1 Uncharacterised protein [Campylobacter hyointestinalis subsp. hyointestinalis]
MPEKNEINSKQDIVQELDSAVFKQEWSYSIIGAMDKIQKQFAIEQNLDVKLHKDYLSDRDKLRYFWSGFTNSAAPKTFLDVLIKSVLNWEILLLIFLIVFVKIFVLEHLDSIDYVKLTIFVFSYISIISYSLYLSIKWRYFVHGDLSSIMMFYLLVGRLLFLVITAMSISYIIHFSINWLYANPESMFQISNGLFWVLNELGISTIPNKIVFFKFMSSIVFPAIKYTSYELLIVFLLFGFLPFATMIIAKLLTIRKKKIDQKKYENS